MGDIKGDILCVDNERRIFIREHSVPPLDRTALIYYDMCIYAYSENAFFSAVKFN